MLGIKAKPENILTSDKFWENFRDTMSNVMKPNAEKIFVGAGEFNQSLGLSVNMNEINQAALKFTKQYTTIWTKQLEKTTRDGLKRAFTDWQEGGLGKRGLPDLIKQIEPLFGQSRAENIAATEVSRIFDLGNLASHESAGIEYEQWLTSNDDIVRPEHRGYSEKVYKLKEGPRPSDYFRCRCARVPYAGELAITKPLPKPIEDVKPVTKPLPKPADEIKKPIVKPAPKPTGTSTEMDNLVDKRFKVSGKSAADKDGYAPTLKALSDAKLPDSHLKAIGSIEINSAKVQRVRGAMAYCDSGGNIVVTGPVGKDNIVHEVGHSIWNKRIKVPDKISTLKYDIADVYNATLKTGKGFVSDYAKSDIDEFFAESYTAYAKDPKALTKLNPAMGKVLKEIWSWK